MIAEAIQFAEQNEEQQAFPLIAKEYIKVNPNAALEWVKTLNSEIQFYSMVEIVKGTQNPETAKQLIESMRKEVRGLDSNLKKLLICAKLMVAFDVKRAIEFTNHINDDSLKSEALIFILSEKSVCNTPETLNLHNNVLDVLSNSNPGGVLNIYNKGKAYIHLAKALHNLNTTK